MRDMAGGLLAETALDEIDGGGEGVGLIGTIAANLNLGPAGDAGGHEGHGALAVDLLLGGDDGHVAGELAHGGGEEARRTHVKTLGVDEGDLLRNHSCLLFCIVPVQRRLRAHMNDSHSLTHAAAVARQDLRAVWTERLASTMVARSYPLHALEEGIEPWNGEINLPSSRRVNQTLVDELGTEGTDGSDLAAHRLRDVGDCAWQFTA